MHPSVKLPWCQQAADEVGGNLLSGAAEEGLGKAGRERGRTWSGLGGSLLKGSMELDAVGLVLLGSYEDRSHKTLMAVRAESVRLFG